MGKTLTKLFQTTSEPTEEDRVMAALVVPVCLGKNLALGDGSANGCPISQALQFDQNEVTNLYTTSGEEFIFCFQEHGVAYNEKEASDLLIEAKVNIPSEWSNPGFSLKVDPTPVQIWGVNFAGKVLVKHDSGEERVVYLPGTRTYDPAGLTGDPHASERIGPSCSRTQLGISISELVAASKGGDLGQVTNLHEQIRALVKRYHGREVLFDWMKLQVEEAVYKNVDVTPYPEFIKAEIRAGRFVLNDAREHTRAYLGSYNRGLAHPPVQYYQKVAKKDNVEELFADQEKLATFKKIIE